MSDPLSIAASVTGLLGLTIELTKITVRFVSDIKDSQKGPQALLDELIELEHTLEQLAKFLAVECARGNAFDRTSVLWNATGDCEARLQSLLSIMRGKLNGKSISRNAKKFRWPFSKEEHKETMLGLYRCRSTFQFSLTIDGCALLSRTSYDVTKLLQEKKDILENLAKMEAMFPDMATASKDASKALETISVVMDLVSSISAVVEDNASIMGGIKSSMQGVQQQLLNSKDRKILRWLSSYQHTERQVDVSSRRSENSGRWLLGRDEFQSWLEEAFPNPFLWCPGKPGAGKTIITSLVIDELFSLRETSNCGVAYFYFDYRDKDLHAPAYVVASLLKQLFMLDIGRGEELPLYLKVAYHNSERATFLYDALGEYFQEKCQQYPRTYIILDAFDEIDSLSRQALIRTLNKAASVCDVRILITSRPHPADIKRSLKGARCIPIVATKSDVRAFLNQTMEAHDDFMDNHGADEQLRSEILNAVVSESDGMFLLPALQLPVILEQPTRLAIRQSLKTMPKKIEETFGASLMRINRQDESCARLAMMALEWIFFSKEPLSQDALIEALAVVPGKCCLDPDNKPVPKLLVGYCMGLAEIDSETGTIRLVHLTLYHYLQKRQAELFPHGERKKLEACLSYLSLKVFSKPEGYEENDIHPWFERITPRNISYLHWKEKFPFHRYAIRNWGDHANACRNDDNIIQLVVRFLDEHSLWLEPEFVYDYGYTTKGFQPHSIGKVRLSFGARDFMFRTRLTALEICIIHNLTSVVRYLLLRNDGMTQSTDGNTQTALRLAVWLNQTSIVELLLTETNVPPNQRSPDHPFSPLWAARARNNHMLERKLVLHGWLPESSDLWDMVQPFTKDSRPSDQCLGSFYAGQERECRVELVSQKQPCDIHDLLSIACKSDSLDFVDWLKGYILLACEKENQEMIKILLLYQEAIDLRLKKASEHQNTLKSGLYTPQKGRDDSSSQSSLESGETNVLVQLLCQTGKDFKGSSSHWLTNILTTPSPFGRSVLHIAAKWGLSYTILRFSTVKGLVNSLDYKQRNLLWEAIINGDEYCIGLLLGGGSDPLLKDSDGNTPLSTIIMQQADGIPLNYRSVPGRVERIHEKIKEQRTFAFLEVANGLPPRLAAFARGRARPNRIAHSSQTNG